MRVRSLVLDNVGPLAQLDSGELPNGLVVFYSPDEQRKTTALLALRRLLFSTNSNGTGSGRTTAHLSGPNGEFELSTNGSPESESFRKLDGQPAADNDLGRLFGQTPRPHLQQVFDITGSELAHHRAEQLNSETKTRSTIAAENGSSELRAQMQSLLAADDSGEIDVLIRQLESTEGELEQALQRQAELVQHLDAEKKATNEVGRMCAELAELRKQRETAIACVDLLPLWQTIKEEGDALAALEPIDDFPEDTSSIGEARRCVGTAEERLKRIGRAHRQTKAELDTLPDHGEHGEEARRIESICSQLPHYREQMSAFAHARARHADLTSVLPQALKKVTNGNSETAFDPSHLDSQALREWSTRSHELSEREATVFAALERARTSLKQLRDERQRAIRAAKNLPNGLAHDDDKWRSLWALRDNLEELWEIQSQGEAAARTAEKHFGELETMDRRRYRAPAENLRKGLWAIAALCFAAALFQVNRERPDLAMALCAVAALAGFADLILGWRSRWAKLRNRELSQNEERLYNNMQRARQLRDSRWGRAEELSNQVATAAAVLGLPATPSMQEVEEAEDLLFQAGRTDPSRGPLTETALSIHNLRQEEEQLMTELREIRHLKDGVGLEWEEWKSSVGLPTHLGQEELSTYLLEYDNWRNLTQESEELDDHLRRLAPAIEEWEAQACALLTELGVDASDNLCGRDLEDQLTAQRTRLRRTSALQKQRTELTQKTSQLEQDLCAAEADLEKAQSELEEIRKLSGTADEEEFLRRRAVYLDRRRIRDSIAEHQEAFALLLNKRNIADTPELRERIAGTDADSLQKESEQITHLIEQREQELEEVSHQRTVAAAGCRELEQSIEVTALQQQCASLRVEIQQRADRWRCLAVADSLLAGATSGSTGGGLLLSEASTRLRNLTDGELVRIAPSSHNGHLVVVDRNGGQHDIDADIAPALAQQVNLSLRLALARDYARGTSIPVVMDEVLRNVAEDRRLPTAAEIKQLAAEQQVFYFTSDQASVDVLTNDIECRVLEI